MGTREKINTLLRKITSDDVLKKILEFIQFMYMFMK